MTDKNTCLTCLDYYGCTKAGLKPSVGQCSLKRPDRRKIALETILSRVKRSGTVYLRRTVTVVEDFCGMDFQFDVRRVGALPGVRPESLRFSVGKGRDGEDVSTENLSTADLEKIIAAFSAI